MKKQIAQQTAQQGDVILRKVESIPAGARLKSQTNLVLAEGEVTGHYHGITQAGSEMFQLDNKLFIKVVEPATITHQEHHPVTLEPGVWEVGRVREFDYLSMMARAVQD